jgi:excisionase family DNA binding protein
MNDLLTTGDVARLCEIPYITAYNWVKSGKIKSQRTPGGHYRINRCDMVDFLQGYGFAVSDDLKQCCKRRILIVSEQPDNIERMLQSADGSYEIASANEGFSAACEIIDRSPDLVLLDGLMPDSISICKQIKTNSKWHKIHILVTSSAAEKRIRFLQAGAEDCLPEPLTQPELLKRVQSLL